MTASTWMRFYRILFAVVLVCELSCVYSQEAQTTEKNSVAQKESAGPVMSPEQYKGWLKYIREQINQPRMGREYDNILNIIWSLHDEGHLKKEDFEAFWQEATKLQAAAYRKELAELEKADNIYAYLDFAGNLFAKKFVYDEKKAVEKEFSKALLRRFDKLIEQCREERDYNRVQNIMQNMEEFVFDKEALRKKIDDLQEVKKANAIVEFRKMLKDSSNLYQGNHALDRLRYLGVDEGELKKLEEEYREALCARIYGMVQEIEVIPKNKSRIEYFYSKLEEIGAKKEMLDDVKSRLNKIDLFEKKSRLIMAIFNGRFPLACSILEEISKESTSEEFVQECRKEFYDNFNEYFQRKVWQIMGREDFAYGNPEGVLDEAIIMYADEELVEEWRRQLRSAARIKYLRMLHNIMFTEDGMTKMVEFVSEAEKRGIYAELLDEMRSMVVETIVPEVRSQIEYTNYKKAQDLVKELEKIKCEVPADLKRKIDDGLMEQNRERFHEECLRVLFRMDLSPEKEQEIKDTALKYGVSEETLNQWREEARNR